MDLDAVYQSYSLDDCVIYCPWSREGEEGKGEGEE